MQYALIDGQRYKASPKQIGHCPSCGEQTRSKCGKIIMWHWAHVSTKHCDSWWESESQWHKEWKGQFPEDFQEVIHHDEITGEKHIADIKTDKGLVIELQHSAISIDELRSRESFYKHMIWLVDGRSFKDRFIVYPNKLPAPQTELQRDLRFNETGSDFHFISTDWFGSGYSKKYTREKYEWFLSKSYKGHHFFEWSHPRATWFNTAKPVFFDFGTDELFELQVYPEHGRHCVKIHSKLDFIQDCVELKESF